MPGTYSPKLKFQVVLEFLKEDKPIFRTYGA